MHATCSYRYTLNHFNTNSVVHYTHAIKEIAFTGCYNLLSHRISQSLSEFRIKYPDLVYNSDPCINERHAIRGLWREPKIIVNLLYLAQTMHAKLVQ